MFGIPIDIHGDLGSLGSQKYAWTSMCIHGYPWTLVSLGFDGYLGSLGSQGVQWDPRDIHGYLRKNMDIYGTIGYP